MKSIKKTSHFLLAIMLLLSTISLLDAKPSSDKIIRAIQRSLTKNEKQLNAIGLELSQYAESLPRLETVTNKFESSTLDFSQPLNSALKDQVTFLASHVMHLKEIIDFKSNYIKNFIKSLKETETFLKNQDSTNHDKIDSFIQENNKQLAAALTYLKEVNRLNNTLDQVNLILEKLGAISHIEEL